MKDSYEYEQDRDYFNCPSCWRGNIVDCPPHFHSSLEIVYVLDGSFSATINGINLTIHKNQVLIVPSFAVHVFMNIELLLDMIVLIVPLDFIPAYKKTLLNQNFAKNIINVSERDSEILHGMKILSKDQQLWGPPICTETSEDANIVLGYIYVILGLLIKKVGLVEHTQNQCNELLKEILIYLQNNYLNTITLESVSNHFSYSRSRFSHIFNSSFGCSISEYIRILRCRHAAGLLSNSVPLIEAAINSGFENLRTFYRAFKICYGMTPTEYCERTHKSSPKKESEQKNRSFLR